jgi:hypothetical protein
MNLNILEIFVIFALQEFNQLACFKSPIKVVGEIIIDTNKQQFDLGHQS